MMFKTPVNEILTAQTDIICYTIVRVHTPIVDEDADTITNYLVPGLNYKILENTINGNGIYDVSDRYELIVENENMLEFQKGFLSLYKTLEDAAEDVTFVEMLNHDIESHFDVYKCAIPEGEIYAEGINDFYEGYASKKIRFIEKIEITKDEE